MRAVPNAVNNGVNYGIKLLNTGIYYGIELSNGRGQSIIDNEVAGLQAIGDGAVQAYEYVTTTPAQDQFWDGIDYVSSPEFFGEGVLALGSAGAYNLCKVTSHFNPSSRSAITSSADDVLEGSGAARGSTKTTAVAEYWPSNGGALGKWETKYLMPGAEIDRFGSGFGIYFSPRGTPNPMRALPGGNTGAYNAYRVVKPFPVKSSPIAPAFGNPGLGTQFLSPVNANTLLKRGIIVPIE